ncbi:hypothetical protein GCM10022251_03510 [Phytohabitans flavus]|uniref:hypothetical protein n=1 Tax=Phytohabitans flavus TaxID=1076124 RepID=UPI0031E4F45B
MLEPGDCPVPLLVRHRRAGGTHVADRRVAGVHRAAGLAGPTRRYTVIVVMLATMSSLPIIAAISTGSANVGDSVDASGGTTPFIPPPSEGPVVVPPLPPPALTAEVPLSAGVAEQLRATAPKREFRERQERRRVRKAARPARPTESAPAPATPPAGEPVKPTEPVRPTQPPATPSPSPSPTPSPRPPVIVRPTLPTPPYLPLPPSASQSVTPSVVPPTGLPSVS